MTKQEIISEFSFMAKVEQILKENLTKEELNSLAEFVDSVEFGFNDFISELNQEINPESYLP